MRKFHRTVFMGFLLTLTVSVTMVYFTNFIAKRSFLYVRESRKDELKRIVDLAYSSAVFPPLEKLKRGEISREEALEEICHAVRRMTYEDEYGKNYIFMSSYDGTMLVQPFEPEKEGTSQLQLKDADGRFIVREIIRAVRAHPEGVFVSYKYYPPGRDEPEEKVSYVKGIPELEAYIGTGLYFRSSFQGFWEILSLQRWGLLVTAVLLLVIPCYIAAETGRQNRRLEREIRLRAEAEKRLGEEKEKLEITLRSIGDGVIVTDAEGRVVMMNGPAEGMTGWLQGEALSRPLSDVFVIVNEETGKTCESPVDKVLKTGVVKGLGNNTLLISRQQERRFISDSAAPIKSPGGELIGVVLVFRDVTKERQWERRISYLSYHDQLTGLYNRRFFEEELKRLDTSRQLPISIIMGDANGLKVTNDVFGHSVGDELLKSIARIIKESCRKEDIVCRWGGDEFAILLPKTKIRDAEWVVGRIKNACRVEQSTKIRPSIALGCAAKVFSEEDIWTVVKRAEDAMYKDKLIESKNFRRSLVNMLQAILYEKSLETREHGERVAALCVKTGLMFGLLSSELRELELLALLHDIGKIGIDERILKKQGPLNDTEWDEIKKHPEIGFRIASNVTELSPIAEYILSHHERWDGCGYPRRLKGEEIPFLSRILAVADAYDVMTTGRPYRPAVSPDEAVDELFRNSGSQFDPCVVSYFVRALVFDRDFLL